MSSKLPSRTRSAGTKLTPEQHAAITARADAEGLELSEYIRRVLLSASAQDDPIHRLESLLHAQLEETLALRILILNLAGLQANGEPLTAERLQAVRAYADEHKAARAQMLLATTTKQSELAASSENQEAA